MPLQSTFDLRALARYRYRSGNVSSENMSMVAPLDFWNIFWGAIIIGVHIVCIVPEAIKLNETTKPTTEPTSESSQFYIMEQKQKQESKENKKTYSIIIISISSIMIALILGAIVTNRLHTYLYTERFYWFTIVLGIIALIVNLILFVIKEQYL